MRIAGGVSIEGPKWCGKTWSALAHSESAFFLEDRNRYGVLNREEALLDLNVALVGEHPRLIDEWQDIPALWDAARSEIDKDAGKGKFVLTGSSTSRKNKPLHSGAGRIVRIRMRTMSLYESGDSDGSVSLNRIMNDQEIGFIRKDITLAQLVDYTVGGGWPGIAGLAPDEKSVMVRAYYDTVLQDASTYDGTNRNKENLALVLKSLARNEGTLASARKICNDTGIPLEKDGRLLLGDDTPAGNEALSYGTVTDYIDVLDRMYLIENQPAFDPNLKSSARVGKVAKRHLADPALAAVVLGATKERLMSDLKTLGCLFESLVERDLDVYARTFGAKLYHYRDSYGREVDAVIEMPDGRWGAFEIKLGTNQVNAAADNLLKFRDSMANQGAERVPAILGVICGHIGHSYRRPDGVYVVSVTSLGP